MYDTTALQVVDRTLCSTFFGSDITNCIKQADRLAESRLALLIDSADTTVAGSEPGELV